VIQIGKRTFCPLKLAPTIVGYSLSWLRQHAPKDFPERIEMSPRKTGFWLDELEKWKRKRSCSRKKRAA
jgi:predicted DNA-binding transcriptional regulator AlpA